MGVRLNVEMKSLTEEPPSVIDAADPRPADPAVAFFDLDGTLVTGQTTLLLVRFLRKEGIVTRRFMLGTALWFVGYKLGVVRVNERTRHQGARVFVGRSVVEIEQLMRRFADEVLAPRFNPRALEALSKHQSDGDHLVVISAALVPVVKAVCDCLGVDDFVGSACEIRDGVYRGRLDGPSPHGDEKQEVATAYMRQWGAEPMHCWAYADHGSDITLLRSVGHPVAVDPKPQLLKFAREAGWPVLRGS